MPDSILAGINQEVTQIELLSNVTFLLAAMLERMPRVTGNDQVATSIEVIPQITFAANQDIRNIIGAIGGLTNIGGKSAAGTVDALNMAGTVNIYNNIIVS